MERKVVGTAVRLVQGDITTQEVDGIVNAANAGLWGGGGVDGAIHRRGGPAIMAECEALREAQGGVPPGKAASTTAGQLSARRVIHAVGPIWQGGTQGENVLLEGVYRSSLEVAVADGLRTVAFPSISTGAYGFPLVRAARIAVMTVCQWIKENPGKIDEVRWVLFTADDLAVYADALEDVVVTQLGTEGVE